MKSRFLSFETITSSVICLFVAFAMSGCTKDNDFGMNGGDNPGGQGGNPGGGGGTTGTSATIAGLTDFNVAFNTDALSETDAVPSKSNDTSLDYVENATFSSGAVYVTYNGSSATVKDASGNAYTGSDITVSGADVTVSGGSYEIHLDGSTTDGSLNVTVKKDQAIYLNGVTLTNADGAAIGIAKKGYTLYVVAVEGTKNTITDGATRPGEEDTDVPGDPKYKSAIFTKGKAVFSGSGMLYVNGNYKNGIDAKNGNLVIRPKTNIYVTLANSIEKGSCIKCENETEGEGMFIKGGVLNLDNPTKAGKGLSADGDLNISGGRVTSICTGTGLWEGDEDVPDVSGSAGVKSDGIFTMTGGDLELKSTGAGGKGINGDSLLYFKGGTVHIITTGDKFTYNNTSNSYIYDSSPKGIKTDRKIYVSGGNIYVRATGTSDGSEGIEAKESYNQTGGSVMVYAADDALNTGYSSESATGGQSQYKEMTFSVKKNLGLIPSDAVANNGYINVSDGTLYVYSESNDAMDSNGYINISGGTTYAFGAGAPETSFDCDNDSRFSLKGGTLFGMGGASPNKPGNSDLQQCYVITSFSSTANTSYTVKASDGTEIITVTVPRTYSGGSLAISSPKMARNTTYTIGSSSFSTGSSWITSSGSIGGMGGNPGGKP